MLNFFEKQEYKTRCSKIPSFYEILIPYQSPSMGPRFYSKYEKAIIVLIWLHLIKHFYGNGLVLEIYTQIEHTFKQHCKEVHVKDWNCRLLGV